MKLDGDINLNEWKEIGKRRDEAIAEWLKGVTVKRCPHCGRPYSFGYAPVFEDPGACQTCRDAEGDLIY
jgi:hypothetical protein